MSGLLAGIGLVVIWIFIQAVVFPRLGVPT
jgi:hypothetical protein